MKRVIPLALITIALPLAEAQTATGPVWEYTQYSVVETINNDGSSSGDLGIILGITTPEGSYSASSLIDLIKKLKMQQEYKSELGYISLFNILGKNGWELVSCNKSSVQLKDEVIYTEDCFFKRLKKL
jgi:hypothetical protein